FPKINGAHAFLDTMLPETGAYAIRGLRKGQPTLSRFVASKEELVDQGREMSCAGYDAYFATASFVSAEGKQDAGNIAYKKAFYLDIDYAKPNPGCTVEERIELFLQSSLAAAVGLKALLVETKLPTPWIVASGNGLHVYWPLDKEITPTEWVPYAQ